jgi:hypothetical protein
MIRVSPEAKKALQFSELQTGNEQRLGLFPTGMALHAETRHWPGKVSCLHAADPSMM